MVASPLRLPVVPPPHPPPRLGLPPVALSLTEDDRELAFRRLVPRWFLERLDVGLGTVSVVPLLKDACPLGFAADITGETYPDWSMWAERRPGGFDVAVRHYGAPIRVGVMPWNNLANRSTIYACELARGALTGAQAAFAAIDEQLTLLA